MNQNSFTWILLNSYEILIYTQPKRFLLIKKHDSWIRSDKESTTSDRTDRDFGTKTHNEFEVKTLFPQIIQIKIYNLITKIWLQENKKTKREQRTVKNKIRENTMMILTTLLLCSAAMANPTAMRSRMNTMMITSFEAMAIYLSLSLEVVSFSWLSNIYIDENVKRLVTD